MINIVDKSKCCGCNACEDICPVEAITFSEDKEGFLYPNVDLDRCIDCELCDKLCPMDKVEDLKISDLSEPECYAAIHKNLEIRFDSTSGGIFSALATKMFKEGGYVGGAVYDNNWGVKQLITNDSSKLVDLRSSKYIQSDSRGFYVQLEDILNKGEKVLVCGLPCQIFAIKSFLRKPYDNLILVDLICRYINSPKAYRKYLNSLEKEYGGKVVYIKAKNKELGWDKLTHKVVFSNGKTYYGTFAIDSFMNASMKANCLSRPACYSCKFKGFPRIGDITLGDYWVNGGEKIFSDNTGTSVIIINSKKGKEFLDGINNIKKMKISLESILPGNPALTEPLPKEKINRTDFYDRIENEDFIKVVSSLFPAQELSFKQKLKNILKVIVRELKYSRFNIRSLIQFAYYNFCHPAIKCNLMRGYVFYVAPHCTIEIDKKAIIELNGPLTLGESVFKHSKLETRIKMQKGSKLIIGNLGGNGYGFGYGSDIELFSDATLISKGGPRTNMGTVIICKTKIVIGEEVAIGRDVTIRDNNGGHLLSVNGYIDSMPVIIGEHAWLCSGATIMSGVKIGDGTIVSANAFVNRSFPPRVVVAGNPAKITSENIYWKM